MKKRILFIGIVLTLVLTLVIPTAAYAKSDTDKTKVTSGSFAASDTVIVTNGGQTTQHGLKVTTRGEIMQSLIYPPYYNGMSITSGSLPILNGATLYVNHSSEITLSPSPTYPTKGTLAGTAINTITLTLRGGSKLYGLASTKINGTYDGNTYPSVTDGGNFIITGKDGDSFIELHGSLNAVLGWNTDFVSTGTLVGSLTINGNYNIVTK